MGYTGLLCGLTTNSTLHLSPSQPGTLTCHSSTVQQGWARHLISLSLNFLMGKMGMIIPVHGGRLACKRFTGINSHGERDRGRSNIGQERRWTTMGWDLSVLCRVVLSWGKKVCFGSVGKAMGKVHLCSGGKVLTCGLPVSMCPATLKGVCAVCHGALHTLQLGDAGVWVPCKQQLLCWKALGTPSFLLSRPDS